MKKFILGTVVGVIVGVLLSFLIIREPLCNSDLDKEIAVNKDIEIPEIISDNEVDEDSDIDEDWEIDEDTFTVNTDIPSVKVSNSIQLKDDKGQFTTEALSLAYKYLIKYNNGDWDGSHTREGDISIRVYQGSVQLDEEDTPFLTDEQIIYDNAVDAYMSGEWDGTEMMVDKKHTVKLKGGTGDLLIDGYCCSQGNLDLPESAYNLENSFGYTYVPGQGTYVIINKKLVKFLRGEKIELPGKKLSWEGFQSYKDAENLNGKRPFEFILLSGGPSLTYNSISGKLYLITEDEDTLLYDGKRHVYVFNDCNISKIEYLGKVDFEHQYPGDVDIETLVNQNK